MKKEVLFITGNEDKFREFGEILSKINLVRQDMNLPELQGTPEEIVTEKAIVAANKTGKPCFVDDTSLCFEDWGGLPGPYIKDFIKNMGVEKLSNVLINSSKNLNAKAITSIGYCEPGKNPICFQGITEGTISKPKGSKNFKKGWDSIFIPNGSGGKTNAEMDPSEKHIYSQRTKAIKLLEKYFEEQK